MLKGNEEEDSLDNDIPEILFSTTNNSSLTDPYYNLTKRPLINNPDEDSLAKKSKPNHEKFCSLSQTSSQSSSVELISDDEFSRPTTSKTLTSKPFYTNIIENRDKKLNRAQNNHSNSINYRENDFTSDDDDDDEAGEKLFNIETVRLSSRVNEEPNLVENNEGTGPIEPSLNNPTNNHEDSNDYNSYENRNYYQNHDRYFEEGRYYNRIHQQPYNNRHNSKKNRHNSNRSISNYQSNQPESFTSPSSSTLSQRFQGFQQSRLSSNSNQEPVSEPTSSNSDAITSSYRNSRSSSSNVNNDLNCLNSNYIPPNIQLPITQRAPRPDILSNSSTIPSRDTEQPRYIPTTANLLPTIQSNRNPNYPSTTMPTMHNSYTRLFYEQQQRMEMQRHDMLRRNNDLRNSNTNMRYRLMERINYNNQSSMASMNSSSSPSSPTIQASISIGSNNNTHLNNNTQYASSSNEYGIQHISIPGMQISIGPATNQSSSNHIANLSFNLANSNSQQQQSQFNSLADQNQLTSRADQIAASQAAAQAALRQYFPDYSLLNMNSQQQRHYHHYANRSSLRMNPFNLANSLNPHIIHISPSSQESSLLPTQLSHAMNAHTHRIPRLRSSYFLDRTLEAITRFEENLPNLNRGATQDIIEANTLPYKFNKVSNFFGG